MKRYLLYVIGLFLLETLLLAVLQDRPFLAPYLKQQDRLLTDAFLAAWPLGLVVLLFRRKRVAAAAPKAKAQTRKPAKRKKKSGSAALHS